MKSKSIIEKGKRFEKFIAEAIKEAGLGDARREIGSGSGKKKGDIFCNLPFMIEAKNWNSTSIQTWIDQAKEQAKKGNFNPEKWALVYRDPRSPEANPTIYTVIDFYQFLDLLKRYSEPRIKAPDQDMRWKIQRLVDAGKAVIKELTD